MSVSTDLPALAFIGGVEVELTGELDGLACEAHLHVARGEHLSHLLTVSLISHLREFDALKIRIVADALDGLDDGSFAVHCVSGRP